MLISGMLTSSRSAKAFIRFTPRNGFLQYTGLILLGIIQTISFCPVSAGFFFGILVPLSTESTSMLLNMSFYSFGTGILLLVIILLTAGGKKILSRNTEHRKLFESRIKVFSGIVVILIGIFLTLDRVFNVFS